jgi:predicted dehydrogenase
MTVRWGLIGCGEIANKRVLPAIVEHTGSELVAVADELPGRAGNAARSFGAAHACGDLDELLATDVEAIYIATPPGSHCELSVAAAEAGRHVLCEKPLAPTVTECRRMIDAADAADVALAAAYYRRWYPAARRIKRMIDDGAIGRPVRAHILTGWPFDPEPGSAGYWRVEDGGGPLMDTACHRLDLMCYWLGEPRRVVALTANLAHDYPAPDTETLMCEMTGGCHLTCETQWSLPITWDTLEVHGTAGSIVAAPFDGEHLQLHTAGGVQKITAGARAENVHLPLVASFAAHVAAGEPPEFDGADGMQPTRIIDAAHRSSESADWHQC